MKTSTKERLEVLSAMKNSKLCLRIENYGLFPIELRQRKADNFTVIYGLAVKENLTYDRAATELGSCIMHALACDGALDNQ